MNLPNKLTIIRILMVPVFLTLLVLDFPHHYLAALIVFVAASLTDMADGKIARERGLITNLGKFLDPLADKMLTTAALLGFMVCGVGGVFGGVMGQMLMWVNFIVLSREFLVTSVRLLAANNGRVVAANIYGKLKTVSQMTAIITTLAFEYFIGLGFTGDGINFTLRVIYAVLIWISVVFTVMSGVIYAVQNKEFITQK
jgi:CDP-diacylglycerol--glycerol-3-phosphate 3-phosphatidyltransferase